MDFQEKGKYEKIKFIVNDSLQETLNLLERTIPKSINIKTNYNQQLWPIEGDSTQILQVFMNLGVNAKDAMPDGGELSFESNNTTLDEAFCKIHGELKPGNYVQVTVSDTGVGMPKEDTN